MRTGYLGLGSNVGERREHLAAAVAELPAHGVRVLASSSTYETEPIGLVLDQRDFLNACLRVQTDRDPLRAPSEKLRVELSGRTVEGSLPKAERELLAFLEMHPGSHNLKELEGVVRNASTAARSEPTTSDEPSITICGVYT